jgi:hypothetical protein
MSNEERAQLLAIVVRYADAYQRWKRYMADEVELLGVPTIFLESLLRELGDVLAPGTPMVELQQFVCRDCGQMFASFDELYQHVWSRIDQERRGSN